MTTLCLLPCPTGRPSDRPTPASLAYTVRPSHALHVRGRRRVAVRALEGEAAPPETAVPPEPAASSDVASVDAISILHLAAEFKSVPPKVLNGALALLEKKKMPGDGFYETLGGGPAPGKRWRLVFTTGTKDTPLGPTGGSYFPITAVQRFFSSPPSPVQPGLGEIENGIFVAPFACLTFIGPMRWAPKLRRLEFNFDWLQIKIGPFPVLRFPAGGPDAKAWAGVIDGSASIKDMPFFTFFYVDDCVAAARGRGGGLALWARTSPVWELENGVGPLA